MRGGLYDYFRNVLLLWFSDRLLKVNMNVNVNYNISMCVCSLQCTVLPRQLQCIMAIRKTAWNKVLKYCQNKTGFGGNTGCSKKD